MTPEEFDKFIEESKAKCDRWFRGYRTANGLTNDSLSKPMVVLMRTDTGSKNMAACLIQIQSHSDGAEVLGHIMYHPDEKTYIEKMYLLKSHISREVF